MMSSWRTEYAAPDGADFNFVTFNYRLNGHRFEFKTIAALQAAGQFDSRTQGVALG